MHIYLGSIINITRARPQQMMLPATHNACVYVNDGFKGEEKGRAGFTKPLICE